MRGTLKHPTLCVLRIYEKGRYWKAEFFAENGRLEFQTPHIDSLSRMFKNEDVRKEKNYFLTGSKSQDVFYVYQQQTIPVRYAVEELEKKYKEIDTVDIYRQLQIKRAELEQITRNFIRNNSDLYVNLKIAEVFDRKPFTYDEKYVDDVLMLFDSYQDTCQLFREFRDRWNEAKRFVSGKQFEDAEVVTPEDKRVRLIDQLNKNGYTFVDLWASWCGSCRVGFPALKSLYECYKDKVKFISVAISDRDDAWRQAMKEENMPWTQFKDSGELVKIVRAAYNTTTIPSFFLVDSNRRIVYKGSRAGEMEVQLEKLLR